MTFEPKKFNEVFEDMRNRTTVISDFEVGSVTRTIYESFANEIALLYEKMRLVYLSAYVDTAEGQQLDQVVSVLGIQRGLPDFAVGVVSFIRDVGNEDIDISLGTLVATEDTPELPKKVYQTFEQKILLKDHTSVEVKIRATERGEDQATVAESINVTPRPIPGVKSVINQDDVRFLGRRRETDVELRERAKNALISSGKASIIAIENALLSLPGVKDIKVKENFHFARGKVSFTRLSGSGDVTIPLKTPVTATIDGKQKPFVTTQQLVLLNAETSIVALVESLLEGQAGELNETSGVTWNIEDPELSLLSVSHDSPILLKDFGIIEVFIDGPDLANPAEAEQIRDEIDRVRAAGIFVQLKPVSKVKINAVFKIEINPDLTLSEEERAEFEGTVRKAIEVFLAELKMGQSLLFSKLITMVLSLEGIENLEDFKLTTIKQQNSSTLEQTVGFSNIPVDIEEFERFEAQYICVASENKLLPVNLQFKATGLDETKYDNVVSALGDHFDTLGLGDAVTRGDIVSSISSEAGITLDATSLTLLPQSWCKRELFNGDDVAVSFVEQPELGDVFAYHSFLAISGALKLTLPATISEENKNAVQDEVRARIGAHLDNLQAEEDLLFEDIETIVAGVDRVLAVELDWQDYKAALNDVDDPTRVTEEKLEVSTFEKAQLADFCITSGIEQIIISVVGNIELDLLLPPLPDPPPDPPGPPDPIPQVLLTEIRQTVANTINNYLSAAEPGQDVIYSEFKGAIEGLLTGTNYIVSQFSLTASSACDSRTQTTNITTGKDIHVRSVELASIVAISESDVVVNIPAPYVEEST